MHGLHREQRQGVLGVGRLVELAPGALEDALQRPAHVLVVVDDEHCRLGATRRGIGRLWMNGCLHGQALWGCMRRS